MPMKPRTRRGAARVKAWVLSRPAAPPPPPSPPSPPPPPRPFPCGVLFCCLCVLFSGVALFNSPLSLPSFLLLRAAPGATLAGAPLPAAAALTPPPLPPASPSASRAPLAPEDAAYAAQLRALLAEDGDPWDVARDAWEKGRVWPATFVRSSKLFVPPPPEELADSLAPGALAALAANKTRDFSIVMPGNAETAIFKYHQQEEYYAAYATAWKGWTWAKGGVDCNRHLEIVSNGAIPIFRNIRAVSPTTLFAYPKRLMAFFEDSKDDTNVRHLAMMRHFMLHWAHKHLSAPNAVAYMMRAADHTAERLGLPPRFSGGGASRAPRVAFIDSSLPQAPDYMSMLLLLGLVEKLGAGSVDVFYPAPYMYEGGPDIDGRGAPLYGLGFGYRHLLARPAAQPAHAEMLARLHAGAYDAAIWGSFTRCTSHFHEAETVAAYDLQPHRLWLFDGHDSYSGWPAGPSGVWAQARLNATVFVREHVLLPL